MAYTFKKPEITNVWAGTWNILKENRPFWFLAAFALGSSVLVVTTKAWWIGQVALIPYLFVGLYAFFIQMKVRASFWKEFAVANGWQYQTDSFSAWIDISGFSNAENESGIMFKQGNEGRISNEIAGTIDNRNFRIFNYQYSTGSGKNKQTHRYTVFSFKFNGSFPDIYLNNRSNYLNITAGEKIPLPDEFEEKFFLSAPHEYEIEALQIFTPDVLSSLLDNGFPYDVEFVNHEMIIFTEGQISNFDELAREFNKALELEDLVDEKLDKFKYEQIGDMPSELK